MTDPAKPDPTDTAGYRDVVTGDRKSSSARAGAAAVPAPATPELKSLLSVVVATLVIAALYIGREVLIPITLAVLLSFVLSPLVNRLQRLVRRRAPAVMLAMLAALAVLGMVATLIGSQAADLAGDAPAYAHTIETKVEGVRSFATQKLGALTAALGPSPRRRPSQAEQSAGAPAVAAPAEQRAVPVRMVPPPTSPLALARTVLAPVLGPLETTAIVLIVAIFFLMQREDLRDRFIRLFGSSDLQRTTRAMDDAGRRLSRYFLSQLAVNSCFGVVIGMGLWLIGVPSPAMWGVLAGMLRFVPYVGSLLAAVAPAALGAAIDPGWSMAIEVIALFFIVEPLTGYGVEPLLYGHSTGLSPTSVIVAALFWTWVWGPIGLIMSTPLTLILVVTGRHVKSLEFFDIMLGDRPALAPEESFYQRVLAGDPDEALAQAEALVADRPLVDYYDEVVLAGLKLAVEDRARGRVDDAHATAMARTMQAVIGDLADHAAPADGTAAAAGATVACVAGNGPFDEVVTAALAQLLDARGLSTRTIGSGETARDAINRLDLAGVTVIAISYLELSGQPARLRYLVRRLRSRAPGAHVVVGLWPQGEAALSDEAIQRTLGADRYVGSLAAAVDAIVPLARDRPSEAA
jgi:predicted PurR-regulated permease PerM